MAAKPVVRTCSLAAWRVMMSPVRSEIAEALRLLGTASIAQIARVIDRPADTLYRHVAALEKHHLVDDAGFRKTGRHAERVFRLAADDFEPDFAKASTREANRTVHETATTLLKAMTRIVRDSAAAEAFDPAPATRNLSIHYELGWLTPEAFLEVRKLLARLKVIMDRSKLRREGELYMTLAMASPVVRKRGAGSSASPLTAEEPTLARRERAASPVAKAPATRPPARKAARKLSAPVPAKKPVKKKV